jgi:hypothetical protein
MLLLLITFVTVACWGGCYILAVVTLVAVCLAMGVLLRSAQASTSAESLAAMFARRHQSKYVVTRASARLAGGVRAA